MSVPLYLKESPGGVEWKILLLHPTAGTTEAALPPKSWPLRFAPAKHSQHSGFSHVGGGVVWGQRWEATANSAGKNGVNICSIGAQYFSDVPLCKCTHVLNSQASDDNVYHVNSICLPCDWIKMCCQCARNSAGQGILTDSGMLICRSTRNRQCNLK